MIIYAENHHSSHRLFEWAAALMMIGIAATIAYDPRSLALGGFSYMARIGLTAPVLWILFLTGGLVRVATLYANGWWPVYGPRARAACALGGAIIWAQMLVALVDWSLAHGYLTIGVSVYFFLALGEILSCYRAASDIAVPHQEVANGRTEQRH